MAASYASAIRRVVGPTLSWRPSSHVTGTTPGAELVTNASSALANSRTGSDRAEVATPSSLHSASTRARVIPGRPAWIGGVTTTPSITNSRFEVAHSTTSPSGE